MLVLVAAVSLSLSLSLSGSLQATSKVSHDLARADAHASTSTAEQRAKVTHEPHGKQSQISRCDAGWHSRPEARRKLQSGAVHKP